MAVFFISEELLDNAIQTYKSKCQIIVSKEFLRCAEIQLKKYFEEQTGIRVTKRIQLGFTPILSEFETHVEVKIHEGVSSLLYNLWFGSKVYFVHMAWASHSLRIYQTSDMDIDCNDIVFWLGGLEQIGLD
jgi:hypothetical protein